MHPIIQDRMMSILTAFVAAVTPWLVVFALGLVVLMLLCAGGLLCGRTRPASRTDRPAASGAVRESRAQMRLQDVPRRPATGPAAGTARLSVIEVRSPDAFVLRLYRTSRPSGGSP